MRLALQLARRGLGRTSPNPVVGAVIVKRGRVVGKGYHRRAGGPHAEVEALRQAGARARGATLYATLEPCNHTGRTPPCCDAVIGAGIARVVIAMKDPNPITNGRGMARLRRAGIRVITGVLGNEAKRLNAPFIKSMTRKLPWVVAKIAQSLDGKIATRTGESRWISSSRSRVYAHTLRRQADAIVIGVNTLLRDDPRLTVRGGKGRLRRDQPIKVIVDSHLRSPVSSRCFSPASPPVIIATTVRSARKQARFIEKGIEVVVLPPTRGRVPLASLFRLLVQRHQIQSVLLEGGGELLASAFEERLVDRVAWFVAPLILGGRSSPPAVGGAGVPRLAKAIRLGEVTVRRVGPDVLVEAAVVYPTARGRA